MDADSIREYLDWYKANFSGIFANREGYKWKSIQTFQKEYRHDKDTYADILKLSFSNSGNLLNSRSVFSLGMMLDILKYGNEHPEVNPHAVDLFYDLFEGIKPGIPDDELLKKISTFRREAKQYVRKYLPDKNNDYQDLHAVSVYLNHRYPDTFYMYRYGEFEGFNRRIGNIYPSSYGAGSNYISYLRMCRDLNQILKEELRIDPGFRLAVQKAINSSNKYYPDPNYCILTQDFLYSIAKYFPKDMSGRYTPKSQTENEGVVETISAEDLFAATKSAKWSASGKGAVKIDYVAQQRENSRLGYAGEEWVFNKEVQKLTELGREDLAKKVVWTSRTDDSKGYDIESFDENGKKILIEVKTTNGGVNTPFFLSAKELGVNQANLDAYRLYRVYDFKKSRSIRVITGDLTLLNPEPTNFIIKTT